MLIIRLSMLMYAWYMLIACNVNLGHRKVHGGSQSATIKSQHHRPESAATNKHQQSADILLPMDANGCRDSPGNIVWDWNCKLFNTLIDWERHHTGNPSSPCWVSLNPAVGLSHVIWPCDAMCQSDQALWKENYSDCRVNWLWTSRWATRPILLILASESS